MPSRTGRPPAATRASSSRGEMPPSGPTTTSTSPVGGQADAGQRLGRPPRAARPSAAAACDARHERREVDARSEVSGIRARRDCLVARATTAAHLAERLRGALTRATRRSSAPPATARPRRRPSSVAASTACSSRSPLASACTSTRRGCGRRLVGHGSTDASTHLGAVDRLGLAERAARPAPSATQVALARPRPARTVAAWRPSSPVERERRHRPTHAVERPRRRRGRAGAVTASDRLTRSLLLERVAQLAEEALAGGRQPPLGTLLAAQRPRAAGAGPRCSSVQARRRLHGGVDEQAAAPAVPRRCVTPRPRRVRTSPLARRA